MLSKLKVRGKTYTLYDSPKKGKKYRVYVNDKAIDFGAEGFRMFPGQKRGQSYCARSSGIPGTNDITTPNFWARQKWGCIGKKSYKVKYQ